MSVTFRWQPYNNVVQTQQLLPTNSLGPAVVITMTGVADSLACVSAPLTGVAASLACVSTPLTGVADSLASDPVPMACVSDSLVCFAALLGGLAVDVTFQQGEIMTSSGPCSLQCIMC